MKVLFGYSSARRVDFPDCDRLSTLLVRAFSPSFIERNDDLVVGMPGWASTVLPIYFLGGIQILCLGVLGEYVGKIYVETKRRPRYLIDCHAGAGSDWLRAAK